MPVISISHSQRRPLPQAQWVGTVYHGLPPDSFTFQETKGDYLLFLGRISPEKRVDRAIEIARRSGRKLKIAAKIDRVDRYYFNKHIKHLLNEPFIELIGEVDHGGKNKLLGGASALLFPIDWPEPFGLVMIEAFACGTPVIGFPSGSVPEIIVEGETDSIVRAMDPEEGGVGKIDQISRARCRREYEQRCTDRHMAEDYIRIYQQLLSRSSAQAAA